jgi:hypothetical protein
MTTTKGCTCSCSGCNPPGDATIVHCHNQSTGCS